MKMKTLKLSVLACAALTTGLISCDPKEKEVPVTKVSVTDSIKVSFSSANPYTFFSFKDSSIITNSDSATNKWDFGMRYVTFIVNSHSSGPGNAGVITQSGIYENFTSAPESGYAYDTTSSQLAINANPFDANSWFLYNDATHSAIARAGQFFVFRTADNHYVKMEVTSITYADFVSQTQPPKSIIYKFRYTYQADGSRNL